MSSASDWSTQREGEREEEPEMPHVNGGGGYHESVHKSLEDSVKDMLRPMLKQWLDENMSRVLTAALKVSSGTIPRVSGVSETRSGLTVKKPTA